MDVVLVFLLNTLVFAVAFIILSRRFDRQYNSRQFLGTVETEVQRIMSSFNQTADENIRVLEDRIETLKALKSEVTILLDRLDQAKNAPLASSQSFQAAVPAPVLITAPLEAPVSQAEALVPPVESVEKQEVIEIPAQDPRAMVLYLHRQGIEAMAISQKTGVPLGETELIIRLHGGL